MWHNSITHYTQKTKHASLWQEQEEKATVKADRHI